MFAQAPGIFAQDTVHLAQFLFAHAHQFVVQIDGFERLDEQGVAAAAGAVNHSVYAPLAPCDHRNHEAIVPDGDEILLKRSILTMRAQEPLERFLNQMTLFLDVAPELLGDDRSPA